jgi:DNA/RNA-binding domain of Phe-tRNA-synthetase-like protein
VSKRIQEALSLDTTSKAEENSEAQIPDPNGYTVQSAVKKDIPGIFYAYTTIKGITNEKKNSQLEERSKEAVAQREGITTEEIGKIESIASYRKLLKATGTDWHSKRPSPEALLRRISQGKSLYSINVAVDAYNIAVIETGIGLGGFDLSHVETPVSLRYSKAGETMHLLGDEAPTTLRDGQLIYADSTKALTMDLNYRDIDSTKITEQTTDIILFADGAPGLSQEDVTNALKQGAELIKEFCGGEIETIHIVE